MTVTALLIDDHPLFRDGFAAMLRHHRSDWTLRTANSGTDAVGLLAGGERPDLAIIDIQLPDSDGFDTARVIGRMAPQVSRVMISGREDGAARLRSRECGASGFISKAWSPEQIIDLLEQILAGGVAFDIFDARIAGIARQFEDFRTAEASGVVVTADDVAGLAAALHLPEAALRETLDAVAALKADGLTDRFGRRFAGSPALVPPYCGVRVTGALFHTQGGLAVNRDGRVLRADGSALPNLFAAGGAAAGVSGPTAAGYLSGNGLLTATVLGRIAGAAAGRLTRGGAASS